MVVSNLEAGHNLLCWQLQCALPCTGATVLSEVHWTSMDFFATSLRTDLTICGMTVKSGMVM